MGPNDLTTSEEYTRIYHPSIHNFCYILLQRDTLDYLQFPNHLPQRVENR